jgi:hypothetical protein
MQLGWKLARVAKYAGLGALNSTIRLRGWATMTVHAFDILATASVRARSHASDQTQCQYLVLRGFVVVQVSALWTVWAFVAQEMDVAHFDFFDTVHFCLVVIAAWRVNTLTGTVASNNFFAIDRLVGR